MSRFRWKRVLLALAVIIAAAAVVFVATIAYFLLVPPRTEDYAHRMSFDSALWQAPSKEEDPAWPVRLRMADDLIASKSLDALSRGEVEALLGHGDVTGKWKDWDLVYWLGPERGMFRIDSEWLVLRFDTNQRVATYRIVRD